jgi:hypothetical protein
MNAKFMKAVKAIFTTAFLCLALCGSLMAQEITANLAGTVHDANGAVVPGATVKLVDPSKNNQVVRTATTNEDGEFSFPNIPVSRYDVSVEAANFKKNVISDIKVDVGSRRNVDVALEAGNISETVTIEASAVAVDLQSPTVGTVISGDQVRELSVNNRNFIQLVTLAPGVSSNLADQVYVGTTNPEGQANTTQISVNGARSSQNTYTVDGADITDRGSNLTIQAYPSIDSIGEFRVLRSLYPAESGRSGGGQINVVTRSGTDKFHGSLFEFVRNEKFNANTFLLNRQTNNRDANGKAIRPPFRYNDYGFTVGGPIYFFRLGDMPSSNSMFAKVPRTYFFFSEEQRKDRRYTTLTSTVPSAALLNGVFPINICLAGTITAGGVRTCTQNLTAGQPISSIPGYNINPVALQYINGIYRNSPRPNSVDPANPFALVSPASAKADFQQEILKIDTSFTDKWSAYYRYERDTIPTIDVNTLFGSGSGIPGVSTSQTDSPGRAHTFQTTYVLNPKMIVEGRYVYSYGAIISNTTGLMSRALTPISTPLPYALDDDRVPHITGNGFSNLQSFGPYNNFSDKSEWSGNLTWIAGNHTMKFGGSFSKYRKNEDNGLGGTNQGQFSNFLNSTAASATQGLICVDGTGASIPGTCPTANNQTNLQNFANFLLGNNATFTQTKFRLTADFRQRNVEAYAQDEFKFRRNLTLYLGMRYSFFGSPWAANGLLSNFVPELYNRAQAPLVTGAGNRVAGSGNFCDGIIVNAQNYTTGPAVYNCTPTASPFGKYVVKAPKKNFAPRVGLAWDPFGKGTTSVRMGYGIYHEQTLIGTFETHLGSNPPYQETITINNFARLDQPVDPSSSPTVVASNAVPALIRGVDIDYKTPYMQHWSLDVQRQFWKNTIVTAGYYGSKGTHLLGVVDINLLPPGYALNQMCAVAASTTPTVFCQQKNGSGVPLAFTSAAASIILDQIRPFRGWRGISMIQPRFNSNYHSLQVSGTQRFSGASQVQIAYTWAKNLTDNQTDRSSAPMNSYDTKAEYGRATLDRRHVFVANFVYELPFYQEQKGFVGKILGGWQSSGIVTYQTGLPFTPTYANFDPAGLGFLNASSPAGGRPYWFSDPNTGAPNTFLQFFNTGAFYTGATPTIAPADPTNAGRGIIQGPRTFRVDFSLMKNFRFGESMSLQLRGEAFNILNMTNYTTLALAASTPSTFGNVTGVRDPRTLQFGAKFYF